MTSERAQYIMDTVDDMLTDLLYYDRKGDERLPVGAIEEAIEQGEITIDQIVDHVRTKLS